MRHDTIGTLREFRTANFTVRCEALDEIDLDLSFDETGETREKLESGELVAFVAHVAVYYKGRKVGENYLGNCIYESFADFMDHRACGKQNRQWEAQGETGRCGSYFSGMIHDAIKEARKELQRERPYRAQVTNPARRERGAR